MPLSRFASSFVILSSSLLISACGGGGGSSQDNPTSSAATSVLTGVFLDSAVENISYRTLTQQGVTNSQGEFLYLAGEEITFFIGDLELPSVEAQVTLTPMSLASSNSPLNAATINILRLLQTLDEDGDPTNGVQVSAVAAEVATSLDFTLPPAEFAADPNLEQLITGVLDESAKLVSVRSALEHFAETLVNNQLASVTDSDSDGVPDVIDSAPSDAAQSFDSDLDGVSDVSDEDDDNDGVVDSDDAFPLDSSEQLDTDLDGIGNNRDSDDDGDSIVDSTDAFPLDPQESIDSDGDGVGNNADLDDDNDGTVDSKDAFPLDFSEQVDTDGDGIGNNADEDDDNDGVADPADAFPTDSSAKTDSDGDGIPAWWENAHGLDDGDANDASLDSDNDGFANYLEFRYQSDPLDENSQPTSITDAHYSFEASDIPDSWQLAVFPEFASDYAHDGTLSLALFGSSMIQWNELFGDVQFELFMRSDCDGEQSKRIRIEIDGLEVHSSYITQANWQRVQVLITRGYHELSVNLDSFGESCYVYVDDASVKPYPNIFNMDTSLVTSRYNELLFYDTHGELLRSVDIPKELSQYGAVGDIAILDDGRVAVFNGDKQPVLSYYTPESNSWQHIKAPEWGVHSYAFAALEAIGTAVYASDSSIAYDDDSPAGIVKFELTDQSVEHFSGISPTGLTVGLDGNLYAVSDHYVYQLDPSDLSPLKTVTLNSELWVTAIAVDENGDIYATTKGDSSYSVRHFSAQGEHLKSLELPFNYLWAGNYDNFLCDISFDHKGALLVSHCIGDIWEVDLALTSYKELEIKGTNIDFVHDIEHHEDNQSH